ncbi:MAG: hypothetical protein ABW061_19190 [Polyangiaceae bacterium]
MTTRARPEKNSEGPAVERGEQRPVHPVRAEAERVERRFEPGSGGTGDAGASSEAGEGGAAGSEGGSAGSDAGSGECQTANASNPIACASGVGICKSGTCTLPIFTTFGSSSNAIAISSDGTTVVGSSPAMKSFRWTIATGIVALPLLANASECFVADVSADGVYAVGDCTIAGKHAPVRWKGTSAPINLGVPSQNDSAIASAVNANGTVVVGSATLNNDRGSAAIWTIGATPLVLPNATGALSAGANAVSANGGVIVGDAWNGSQNQAFRWTTSGGMQLIPYFASPSSAGASDVSADGSKTLVSDAFQAYIWSSGVLDKVGSSAESAIALSSDGTVVLTGHGTIIGGVTQTMAARLATAGYDLGDFIILGLTDISGNGKSILGSGYHNIPNATYDGFLVTFP